MPEPVFLFMKRTKHKILILLSLANIYTCKLAAQQQDSSEELFQQSKVLIEQRDLDKAKLSLNLYQKYVAEMPVKWLKAQTELIKIAFEENQTALASNLFSIADQVIRKHKLEKNRISQELSLLKSNFYANQNNFEKSNKILESLIERYDDAQAENLLLNNLLDKAIKDKLLLDKTPDISELSEKVTVYESGLLRNPIDVLRLKNKLNILKQSAENSLEIFKNLADLWIPKDEYLMLLIHLNTEAGNDVKALSIWEENKEVISIKTFAGSVAIITELAAKISQYKPGQSKQLLKASQHLIRNEEDRARVIENEIEILIDEKKLDDAITTVEDFLSNNPESYNAAFLRASLCLALIDKNDLSKTKEIFSKINKNTKASELKSKLIFIEANILNSNGSEKEAAALFLRVGQTSKDKKIVSNSLYKAGLTFEKLKQYDKAAIAFKQLIAKKRNPLTDATYKRLYKVQVRNKKFKEALTTIDAILNKSASPTLKEDALYDKGYIFMRIGDTKNAIKSFNDFAVVYPKNIRSSKLLFEIYKIQKESLKNLEQASETLNNIINTSKDVSPDIYARSLHHRALLHLLNGETRLSISLWQKYLEFTRTLQHPLTDEVKLQLAAAYQNSTEYNDTAALSIFADIAATTKDEDYRRTAIENLAFMKKGDEIFKEAVNKLFINSGSLSEKSLDFIFTWMHELDGEKDKELIKDLTSQLLKSTSAKKSMEPFWQAQLYYFKSRIASEPQKASDGLKMALNLLDKSSLPAISKSTLKIKILEALKYETSLLDEYLNVIYYFQNNLAKDNYADWQLYYNACFKAISLLKTKNQIARISSLRQRLVDSKLPGHEKVLKRIDDILKVEVEKSDP